MNQGEVFVKEFTSDVDSCLKDVVHIPNHLFYICLFKDFARWNTNFISLDTIDFKLLQIAFKLLITINSFRRYNANIWIFTYLNNKLYPCVLEILNYDRSWENKKFSHEH